MNNGQKLWKEAIEVIPGGNGLLSKRPDRYAKDLWPVYFSKAKGCKVWDLDGNEYIDMAQNGIGTAILGYADDDVNLAVCEAVKNGVNTTLNAPEEVALAKKLLELNPTMSGVKFARGGGEAMSLAVRIARTYTKKDKIIFSGYHGWTDWYLATNLQTNSNLDEHLLPGLKPAGVPSGLSGTALPFKYNDIKDFHKLLNENKDIAAIVLEGARYDFPTQEFLSIIDIESKKRNIIVIVDEITSGFRINNSGTYRAFDFSPDIAVYGKAMGNGFAISAVVGKKNVMDASQDTFISSTMWTERVGFVAGLATLNKICDKNIYKHLIEIGSYIGQSWKTLAIKHNLDMDITEYKPLITFKINYGNKNNAIMTLFIQEMLKRGYLSASSVYITYAHTKDIADKYLINVDNVFAIMSKAIKDNTVEEQLKTEIRTDMFKRLN